MPKRVNSMQGLRVAHMTTARRKAWPMGAIICRPARAHIGPASELVIASIDDLAEHHGSAETHHCVHQSVHQITFTFNRVSQGLYIRAVSAPSTLRRHFQR
jgi:hypothetical protein